MANYPVTTEIQIGDILRFDGLQIKGRQRDHNRAQSWFTVTGIDSIGNVTTRVEKVEGHPSTSGAERVPYDRLTAMIEGGIYQIVEKVGD